MPEQLMVSGLSGTSPEDIITEKFPMECILLAYPYIYYSTPTKQ